MLPDSNKPGSHAAAKPRGYVIDIANHRVNTLERHALLYIDDKVQQRLIPLPWRITATLLQQVEIST